MWPPEYKIRRHRRARSVKLRASKQKGLEVTIPYRFNSREIPSILEENKAWIVKQLTKLQASYTDELPTKIEIPVLNKTWSIRYVPSESKLNLIHLPENEIVIIGNIEDKKSCKDKLVVWLKRIAREYLPTTLHHISNQARLSYEKLSIRDQNTRWGSCSSRKNINLNYKLIFLPPDLAAHVMIHELCHTKFLDHSDKFWQLVAKFDQNWELNKRALRDADKFIPAWL